MITRCFASIAGALFLSVPAYADTRDDVVQGILRCAAIKDDRTWLDCTYGAQQPMRAKLGLPSAPDFQQRLVPPAASSGTASPPSASVLTDQEQRATPTRQPKPSISRVIAGTAAPVTVSTAATVAYDTAGLFVVTLQNGQVWHQRNYNARAREVKPGVSVAIRPGALWSYNLQVNNGPVFKVERQN